MCLAVKYMHGSGVSHRDLKCENFIFAEDNPDSDIKLIDFGVSREGDLKRMRTVVGTPDYMAPEIITGPVYSEKCDIWSLGVILYMMLSLTKPFVGTEDDIYRNIVDLNFNFEVEAWKGVSTAACELV